MEGNLQAKVVTETNRRGSMEKTRPGWPWVQIKGSHPDLFLDLASLTKPRRKINYF